MPLEVALNAGLNQAVDVEVLFSLASGVAF